MNPREELEDGLMQLLQKHYYKTGDFVQRIFIHDIDNSRIDGKTPQYCITKIEMELK